MTHTAQYLLEVQEIARTLPEAQIESLVAELVQLRNRGGRLFLVGLGGSAANCSHAVNDFRRLCGIDASSPVDNVSELTASMNDDGRNVIFRTLVNYSTPNDRLMVFSVGGGEDFIGGTSEALCDIMDYFPGRSLAIVGKDGGYAAKHALVSVIIPTVSPERVTPHTEAFQMVILHLLVSHPDLQIHPTKW